MSIPIPVLGGRYHDSRIKKLCVHIVDKNLDFLCFCTPYYYFQKFCALSMRMGSHRMGNSEHCKRHHQGFKTNHHVKIPFEMCLHIYPNIATINTSPFQKNVKQLTKVLQWYGSSIKCLVCLLLFQSSFSALLISHFAIMSAATTSTCVKICYVHKITGACRI